MDNQGFSIITPYSQNSRHPTNQNRIDNHHQPLRDHVLQPAPRQYTTGPEFQDNYGNEPSPSMLQDTPRYPDSSRIIKEEHDLNTYLYPPTDFGGEMDLNGQHPTHPDHNTIRYPASHNPYPSNLNSPNNGGLTMPLRLAPSRLESPEVRLASGPAETDFHYRMRVLQPQHQHQHHPQQLQQYQNHALNHIQGSSAFFSPSITYSSLDHEHSSPGGGGLDRQPQSQLSSLEYDSREPHPQHVSVPGIVYDSQQGVRHDTSLNHRGSLPSTNSSSPGPGSYHIANSPVSSIPMSNNKHKRPRASSMNTSVPGAHTSSSFSMGPSTSSRWAGHPSGYDMAGSTLGVTSAHGQVSSTPASVSSSLGPILRHSDSDRRSSPENSFTQDTSRLHASTSAQALSSSQSTHSHTNSPSPLSDNEPIISGRCLGSELFPLDNRERDQNIETVVRMSEKRRKEDIGAGEEVAESSSAPIKKRKKSKMHCCEICRKKFPRPSGLRTHMNTHNNEKPFPCGFPGCTRSFGVRSNAKRHLRTHGIIPTPAANPTEAPYIVGFCPPMIVAPQSSSHQQSQLHSIEGGEGFPPGIRLLGDNANIHTQGQGQSDIQHEMNCVPQLKLKWMPPSLTLRTNARSLREVRDRQQAHWMGSVVEADEEEDFVGGNVDSSVRLTGGGGYDMDMEQDDTIDDGDEVEFGKNIPTLSIPLRPALPTSSTTAVAGSTTCRSSPSSSSLVYGHREIEITSVGGGGVYTGSGNHVSREYSVREARTEERNSYLETGSHPYHPSQFRVLPGPAVANPTTPSATVRSYLVVGRE